jgi:two-component system cell cycle response regulator DivK
MASAAGGKPLVACKARQATSRGFSATGFRFVNHLAIVCRMGLVRSQGSQDGASWHERAEDGILMPKKVMIVEDNELNMKLFRDLIEASGYDTVRTRNGLEALDLARQHRPDLILMDIQLPEVSGLEVTKWQKEDDELHVIPIIAVTAFAMKGDEERIRQGGCEAYISKPISVPRFIETIKSYLGDA